MSAKPPQTSPFSSADFDEAPRTAGDEILAWLDREGVAFKSDDCPQKSHKSVEPRSKRARELVVDLHGLTVVQAQALIEKSMSRVKVEGYQQLLFIHGRGNHSAGGEGKIKSLVLEMIEGPLADKIASFHFAPPHEGGGGATRVIVR